MPPEEISKVDNVNGGEMKQPEKKSNKTLIIVLIVALALVILGSISYGVTVYVIKKPASKNVTKTEEQAHTTATVQITAKGFVPASISVKPGTTVTWQNLDTKPHQVASDPYPTNDGLAGFDSVSATQPKGSYSFTFDEAGTFGYHDQLNPYTVKGIVVVK